MINRWLGMTARFCFSVIAAAALTACGGGGGSDNGGFLGPGGTDPAETWSLQIALTDEAGNSVTSLSAGESANLSVLLTDATSKANPIVGEVVTVSATLANVAPAASATTDSAGEANFTISGGDIAGAATVTVSADSPAGAVSAKINFNVDIASLTVTASLTDSNGDAINTIDPLNPGRFVVLISDDSDAPVAGVIVNASSTIGLITPNSGSALSDADGLAVFLIEADGLSGAGTLTASVDAANGVIISSINFAVDAELPYTLNAVLKNSAEEAVVTVETAEALTLEVEVLDELSGTPIPFQIVNANIGNAGTILPASGNALTDEQGIARFNITIGNETGAFPIAVSAVLAGGTVSDELSISVVQAVRKLGYFNSAGSFVEGVIKVEPAKQLSPTGTAALTVAVVDADNARSSSEETIQLTSECLFGTQATIDPASPITFTSQVTVSYTVTGCSGADEITATLASTGATAAGTVEIADLVAEAISFEAADPEIIALRDTGNASDLTEKSSVSFKVTDLDGNPVSDVKVNFELSTTIGGIALSCSGDSICDYNSAADQAQSRSTTATDRSDLDGIAIAELLSGYVATPVRVIAYIDLNENGVRDTAEPQSSSKSLVITTGLPDQDSISVAASPLNVAGAYDTDGISSEITVRMADKFNNPVPDGTQAVFITEYGSIVGSCLIVSGACSVTWTSQDPRSSSYADAITLFEAGGRNDCRSHNVGSGPCPDDFGSPRGGRSTILVYAIGEESFVDANGNGRYDSGEFWTNLPEAFRDENEDGVHTPTQRANCGNPATADDTCLAGFDEDFVDFNENGAYDLNNTPAAAAGSSLPNGLYNGVLCQTSDAATGVCSRDLVNVRDEVVLVEAFSDPGAYALLTIDSVGDEPTDLVRDQNYTLYVADIFNNPPPPGSTISYEGSGRCDVLTPAPTIGDLNYPHAFAANFAVSTQDGEDPTADPDQVSILLTLPNGGVAVKTYSCCVQDPGGLACTP